MKFTKYSFIALALASASLFSACQTDYDESGLDNPVATLEANTSIADVKAMLADKSSIRIPMKDEATSTPYVIKGRVISSDISGNIFKTLVIQDETAALNFSINGASLYTNYREGQEVLVNLTDLWGGLYHDLICIGAGYNEYGSLVTSRMSPAIFKEHTQLNGLPDETTLYIPYGAQAPADKPYCIVFNSFSELPSAGADLWNLQSQLVEFPNVRFADGGKAPYAIKDENVSRNILDATGALLALRNSGKSNFFNTMLPEGTGTVRGILSYYNGAWQLLIRDLDDVIFDGKGSKEAPYTIEEALAQNNNGRTAWTAGYIVGSVKAGVSSVSSASDVIFGKDAELDNNLLIAPAADCTDLAQCMVVALPVGTPLRRYANLADNPDMLGHKLSVTGSFSTYLGLHGITACPGTLADFVIEGTDIGQGMGQGTLASPYSVDFVLSSEDPLLNVYVEGYVVGFVAGRNYFNNAQFSSNTTGMDYGNNNLILASSPGENDAAKAIPVSLALAYRDTYGLGSNPSIFGKKVRFRCTTGNYLGSTGITQITEAEIIE